MPPKVSTVEYREIVKFVPGLNPQLLRDEKYEIKITHQMVVLKNPPTTWTKGANVPYRVFEAPFLPSDRPHVLQVGTIHPGDIWLCVRKGNESIWTMRENSEWARWEDVSVPVDFPESGKKAYLVAGGNMRRDSLEWAPSGYTHPRKKLLQLNLATGNAVAEHLVSVRPQVDSGKRKRPHDEYSRSPSVSDDRLTPFPDEQTPSRSPTPYASTSRTTESDIHTIVQQFGELAFTNGLEGTQFPPGSEEIKWSDGMRTFLPWIRDHTGEDRDVKAIKNMAAAPNPTDIPEEQRFIYTFDIRQLCKDPHKPTDDEADTVTKLIKEKIAQGRPILMKGFGWTGLDVRFERKSIERYKGSLKNLVTAQEARLRLNYEKLESSDEAPQIHLTVPLEEFIEKATAPDEPGAIKPCANLLDSYSANRSEVPWVISLLNEQEIAMYHNRATNHVEEARNTKRRKTEKEGDFSGPQTMHPDQFYFTLWDLLTHAGYISHIHHDAAGAATWMSIRDGAKYWTLIYVKPDKVKGRDDLIMRFSESVGILTDEIEDDVYLPYEIETIRLMRGDILIQPPNVMHSVYTPVKTIATGGHFYLYDSMHLTEIACQVDHQNGRFTTNQVHQGAYRLMVNMALALPNRWDKPMLKIPFLGLAKLILKPQDYIPDDKGLGSPMYYPDERQEREIRGEFTEAQKIIKTILKHNCIDEKDIDTILTDTTRAYDDCGTDTVDLSCFEKWLTLQGDHMQEILAKAKSALAKAGSASR